MRYSKLALFCLAVSLTAVACVDEKYDLDKMDGDLTLVDDLVLPLGETDPITFKDIVDSDTSLANIFKTAEDGSYRVSFADSADFSDNLPELSGLGAFDGAEFTADVNYKLEGITPEAFSFPSIDKSDDLAIFEATTIPADAFKFKVQDFVTEFNVKDSLPSGLTVINIPESMAIVVKLNNASCFINAEVDKPAYIESVDTVWFSSSKGLDMSFVLGENSLPSGMNAKVKSFSVKFPENIKVKGADASGTVTFTDESFPFKKTLLLEYLLPETAGKLLTFTADVDVKAEIAIWGNAPVSSFSSASTLTLGASADLVLSDFSAMTKNDVCDLDIAPVKFSLSMPEGVSEFGTMKLTPKGSPAFTVSINIPETDLVFNSGADGIVVTFPEMLTIDENLPSGCTYNPGARKLTVKGDIPKNMRLGIKYLSVTPKKDETGKYVSAGEVNLSGSVNISKSRIHKKDVDAFIQNKCGYVLKTDPIEVASIGFEKLSVKFDEKISTPLLKEGSIPEEVVEIKDILFENTFFNLSMDCSGLPSIGAGKAFDVALKAKLPDWVTPSEIVLNGTIENNKFNASPVEIKKVTLIGMDLTKAVNFDADVNFEISAVNPAIDVSTLSENIKASVKGGIKDISVKRIDARFDYSLEEIRQCFDLSELLGGLGGNLDMNLSLDNPYLKIDIASNMGIPVMFQADLLPYSGGRIVESAKSSFNAKFEKAASPDVDSHLKLFLAGKNEGRPGDYQFKQVDFAKIFNAKPDSIAMSFSAKTVKDEVCTIIMGQKYRMKAGYEVGTPLSFGDDFNILFRDTLDTENIGKFMQYVNVALLGDVENGLPISLDLGLSFLDENDREISLKKPAKAVIESCNSDGTVNTSSFEFEVSLSDSKQADAIRKTVLEFSLGSGTAAGVPVKEDSYIKAALKLKLPDGITMNIDELTKKEEK